MGKLLCNSSTITDTLNPSTSILSWQDSISSPSLDLIETTAKPSWFSVSGLEDQQKRCLQRLYTKGVLWKNPEDLSSWIFRLSHGGDVDPDGNCLFTALQKSIGLVTDPKELRRKTVWRFVEDLGSGSLKRNVIDIMIKNLYSPDLETGWGVHIVQEVKLLAKKEDRKGLDVAINELLELGMRREVAAESIYKERCIAVDDGPSWASYMSISGSPEDEYDIISLQYTEDGLLTVDENRGGHAAAFGDDIAIESLATEFKREIYVVQAHGFDAMADEDNSVFFLPHKPRNKICGPPIFVFMKGTGWCGAGADHYEPLLSHPSPPNPLDKVAVAL